MFYVKRNVVTLSVLLGGTAVVFVFATGLKAQSYTPSKPTVSPYLNLFQNNRNGAGLNRAVPNYYTLVRPQIEQQQTNQIQQQVIQQQGQTIGQLQGNLQQLEKRAQVGQPIVPTGHGSWYGNTGTRSRYLNTSRYYARAGTLPAQPSGNQGR